MTANRIADAQKQLDTLIRTAYAKAFPGKEMRDFIIEIPKDTSHGDFASNAAMVNAKNAGKAPRDIAAALLEAMDFTGSYFVAAETAGPGFMNFRLGQNWFSDSVQSVLDCGADYGRSDYGHGEKVMVEFVSANPTGPMHMGNARGGAIGDCLASALDFAGYKVCREFYINDAGNQIVKFGKSLEARYLQLYLGEDAVEFPEDGYQGEDIKVRAKEFADLHGDKYVNAPSEERTQALIDYALPANVEGLRRDLEKYRIQYDVWFSEKSLHESGAVMDVVKLLSDRGMTYEKDGAVWYKATEFGAEKDEVLVRANGIPTYFTADIAYHYNKFAVRGFDRVIDVWGADHHGHVRPYEGFDGCHRPGRQQAGCGTDAAGAPDEGRSALQDEQADRQGYHPHRPAGGDPHRCRPFLLQYAGTQLHPGLRPRPGCGRDQPEPGLLCSVCPRPDLQHSQESGCRRNFAPSGHCR